MNWDQFSKVSHQLGSKRQLRISDARIKQDRANARQDVVSRLNSAAKSDGLSARQLVNALAVRDAQSLGYGGRGRTTDQTVQNKLARNILDRLQRRQAPLLEQWEEDAHRRVYPMSAESPNGLSYAMLLDEYRNNLGYWNGDAAFKVPKGVYLTLEDWVADGNEAEDYRRDRGDGWSPSAIAQEWYRGYRTHENVNRTNISHGSGDRWDISRDNIQDYVKRGLGRELRPKEGIQNFNREALDLTDMYGLVSYGDGDPNFWKGNSNTEAGRFNYEAYTNQLQKRADSIRRQRQMVERQQAEPEPAAPEPAAPTTATQALSKPLASSNLSAKPRKTSSSFEGSTLRKW